MPKPIKVSVNDLPDNTINVLARELLLEASYCNHVPSEELEPLTDAKLIGTICLNEKISTIYSDDEWSATKYINSNDRDQDGTRCDIVYFGKDRFFAETPNLAVLRCFIASKLGYELELDPKMLKAPSKHTNKPR